MTSRSIRSAAALGHLAVNLFAPREAESMVGDLCEEFSQMHSKAGCARSSWYWRQSLQRLAIRSALHSARPVADRRRHNWRIFCWVGSSMACPARRCQRVTDRYLIVLVVHHFQAYMWVLKGMLIEHLILSMLVGCIVAWAAKGREMVATITLALVRCALIGAACYG